MYLSYAILCGLVEAIIARSLYSAHHFFLFRTISGDQYTRLSILMGIIYGLFSIIDLGLFDSIGPWFSRYTASKRHFRSFFLPQLFFSWVPLSLAYAFMLHAGSSFSWVYIAIGIAEHTKRILRLLLNVSGYARMVAITEGLSYLSYVLLVWLYFFAHGAHTFSLLFHFLAVTSIAGVSVLALGLVHLYRYLPADSPVSFSWRLLGTQRASCTLSNLMTAHGLHTIVLPLLAHRYTTNAPLLSCTNAIIAALSTIIYKLITVAGTITFNLSRSFSLQRMLQVVAVLWIGIIGVTTIICFSVHSSITSYILISISIYAAHSVQHITKLALDAQFQSLWHSIIITLSSLFTHCIFYASLASLIPVWLSGMLITTIMVSTFIITYLRASRIAHFIPAPRITIDPPSHMDVTDQPHP